MDKTKKIKNIFVEGSIPPEKVATMIANHQSKTNIGAHDIFLGQVRADTIDGKTVEAEVGSFQPEKYLQVFMNTVKVNLQYQPAHKVYVGNMAGMEFVTSGPKMVGSYR